MVKFRITQPASVLALSIKTLSYI